MDILHFTPALLLQASPAMNHIFGEIIMLVGSGFIGVRIIFLILQSIRLEPINDRMTYIIGAFSIILITAGFWLQLPNASTLWFQPLLPSLLFTGGVLVFIGTILQTLIFESQFKEVNYRLRLVVLILGFVLALVGMTFMSAETLF